LAIADAIMDDSNTQSFTCPICGANNSTGSIFCGQCGTRLDVSGDAFRSQIRSILKSELQDQTVVEIQTAQKIVARVSEWAKLFGFFAGITLVIFAAALAILGYRSLAELQMHIQKATSGAVEKTEGEIASAKKSAERLEGRAEELATRYDKLEKNADKYEKLDQKFEKLDDTVNGLQQRVTKIEGRKYEQTSLLIPGLKNQIDANLETFQSYLAQLGYVPQQRSIGIELTPDDNPLTYRPTYDGTRHLLIFSQADAADRFIPLSTYMNSVLWAKGVPTQDPDAHWQSNAVEAGLAGYFAASFLRSATPTNLLPAFDLTAAKPWNSDPTNFTDARHVRNVIWASICWQIQTKIGRDAFDQALFRTWVDLEAQSYPVDFVPVFARHLLDRLGPNAPAAREILVARKVPL
jgi:hypothetical protein